MPVIVIFIFAKRLAANRLHLPTVLLDATTQTTPNPFVTHRSDYHLYLPSHRAKITQLADFSHFVGKHLDWIPNGSVPIDQLTDKGLSSRGYDVDVQSIKIHFGVWKQLHKVVRSKKIPIPRCTQIVPRCVAYWNKNKVFIDVMSRYLLHIKIPFKHSSPILQLVVWFLMYLTVNGFLTTQCGKLHESKLFNDDSVSYVDLKKRIAKAGNLRIYIYIYCNEGFPNTFL